MPYVHGESLRELMTRESQLPLGDALRITREVASALDYAHGAGYMHRDVTPDNIMVTTKHDTMLADFGIARPMKDASGRARDGIMDVEIARTTTGFVIGSPQYMSPEQIGGDPSLDGRTDQYSLGTVLYETLASETPFAGRNAQAVVAKMFAGAHRRFGSCAPTFPSPLTTRSGAHFRWWRNDRFASIPDFAEALHIASSEGRAGISGAATRFAPRLRAWRARE